MKALNQIIKMSLALAMLAALGACDKKKDGKANISNRNTRNNGYQATYPGGMQQGPGGSYTNSQCPNCGSIYGVNSSTLESFVGAPGEIGYVSSNRGDTTGVVFQGNVDSFARGGNVSIIIWDEIASQYGEPFVVQMQLDPAQTRLTNTNGTLVFRDNFGSVVFQGNFSGGAFRGSVSFQNADGSQGNLGSFETGECSFVQCR